MQKVLMCLLGLLVVFVIAVAGTLIGASVFAEGDTRSNALQLLEGGGGYVWQAILLAIGYAVGKGRQKADATRPPSSVLLPAISLDGTGRGRAAGRPRQVVLPTQ